MRHFMVAVIMALLPARPWERRERGRVVNVVDMLRNHSFINKYGIQISQKTGVRLTTNVLDKVYISTEMCRRHVY